VSYGRFALWAVAYAILLTTHSQMACSQELITQNVLSLDVAQVVAKKTLEKCRADGCRVSVTALDGSGLLKVFVRDDGSDFHTLDGSGRKASLHSHSSGPRPRLRSSGKLSLRSASLRVRLVQVVCRSEWAVRSSAVSVSAA
jgi:hypothetical protein